MFKTHIKTDPISGRDIAIVRAIREGGSISRAASLLGLSQPAVSRALTRIEQEAGVSLFLRSRLGARITPDGENFIAHSRHVEDAWNSLVQSLRGKAPEPQGVFRFGVHSALAIQTLPEFLPQLLVECPGIQLQLYHDLSRHLLNKLVRSELDLALVVNPTPVPDLVERKLYRDNFQVWQSRRKKLGTNKVIIADPDISQVQKIIRRLKGFSNARLLPTTDFILAGELAARGVGVAILPETIVNKFFSKGLTCLPGSPAISDQISLVYHKKVFYGAGAELIKQSISGAFSR